MVGCTLRCIELSLTCQPGEAIGAQNDGFRTEIISYRLINGRLLPAGEVPEVPFRHDVGVKRGPLSPLCKTDYPSELCQYGNGEPVRLDEVAGAYGLSKKLTPADNFLEMLWNSFPNSIYPISTL